MRQQNAPAYASDVEETSQESDPASAATDQSEVEDLPEELTDVSATVVREAEVRIRPGLAWREVDRLEAGASVTAMHQAGGWVRIRYGDGLAGWIRETALDLGEIEAGQLKPQPAPPLIAEWRGEEYGVMGQSADGAEVRLRKFRGEPPWELVAPTDEVTLIDSDVALQDLPIVVEEATVVFPGDDFRVGQGKLFPRANEWMWLDDRTLIAHNDTHVWRWHSETDKLDLNERPPGHAKLSPNGRYLAIANLCPRDLECSIDNSVVIIRLDGLQQISFSEELRDLEVAPTLGLRTNKWIPNLEWSGNSNAFKLRLALYDAGRKPNANTTLLFLVDGNMVRFESFWQRELQGSECFSEPTPDSNIDSLGEWEFRDDNTIASDAVCVDNDGDTGLSTAVFTVTGKFLRLDPLPSGGITYEEYPQIRSAAGADELGPSLEVVWSPSGRHALVASNYTRSLWLFDAGKPQLRPVELNDKEHPQFPEGSRWGCGEASRFCWRSSWYEDKQVAVMWEAGSETSGTYRSSGGYLIDVSDGSSKPMPFWSGGFYSWFRWTSHDWRPTGDLLKVRFWRPPEQSHGGPFRWDGLVALEPDLSVVLIVRADGTPLQFLYPRWACSSEGWSTDGEWFVIADELNSCFIGH